MNDKGTGIPQTRFLSLLQNELPLHNILTSHARITRLFENSGFPSEEFYFIYLCPAADDKVGNEKRRKVSGNIRIPFNFSVFMPKFAL